MALATIPGVSSLGVKFGYGVETSVGKKPTAFIQLQRCNSIGGISLETEQIDASALEDMVSKYTSGREDTGGTWTVTFNYTNETSAELKKMIEVAKTGRQSDFRTWFTVWSPYITEAFYIVAEPPKTIPLPEMGQNELQTVELTFTINEYKGPDVAIEPKYDGQE